MLHALEFFGNATADSLGGRGGRQKFGELVLQTSQFLQHHVEFVVADGGLGQNVIVVVVLLQR